MTVEATQNYPRPSIGWRLSGEKLRTLRMREGLTTTELAQAVSRSERSVYGWEREGIQPHREVLPRLAELLGVPVDDLLA